MSYCERIAQFAHDKWANVSNLLRSLRTNEQIALFYSKSIIFSFAHKKMSDSLKKIQQNLNFWTFLHFFKSFFYKQKICSFLLNQVSEMSDREGFAQVAQKEWVILSKSLRSLTKNEQMSKLLTFWANCSFAHFFGKKRVICSKIWWANSFQ